MTDAASQAATEAALTKLCHDFAFYMDYQRYDDLVALFTPDALFDRIMHVHNGQDEIMAGLKARPATQVTRHVSTNFHFEHVSADEVRGVIYNMSYFGFMTEEGTLPVAYAGAGMMLEFHDRYLRTPEGWRIAERVARPVLLEESSPMRAVDCAWKPSDVI
ncbi:nuclear transport factor 2 family protein [Actibacterium sp. D379-3]